eukprot:11180958-Lingulodinium_polyedra.AAC.1
MIEFAPKRCKGLRAQGAWAWRMIAADIRLRASQDSHAQAVIRPQPPPGLPDSIPAPLLSLLTCMQART